MASFSRFEEIKAWQLARRLTVEIYAITKKVPFSQDFELKRQIQAAAGSIMHQSRQLKSSAVKNPAPKS